MLLSLKTSSCPCNDRRNSHPLPAIYQEEPLFFIAMSSLLLNHPFANIRGAIHHLNSTCLALVEQANSVEIDNVDLIQIQSRRLSGLFDFGAHFDKVRTSKFAG